MTAEGTGSIVGCRPEVFVFVVVLREAVQRKHFWFTRRQRRHTNITSHSSAFSCREATIDAIDAARDQWLALSLAAAARLDIGQGTASLSQDLLAGMLECTFA